MTIKEKIISVLMVLVPVFVIGGSCVYIEPAFTSNQDTDIVKVKSKEAFKTKESSYYLVFSDKEVFMVDDSITRMVFNSSDIYGSIDPGSCYAFKVFGYRSPMLSQYRRIIEVKPATCKELVQ
jgi:hypothetical protein